MQDKSKVFLPGIFFVFVLLGIFGLFNGQLGKFADDPGVGWHLASGKLMLESGIVPKTDPFLHSTTPRRWISDQWLSDIFLYLLYSSGGWQAIYLALSLIFIFTFLFLHYLLTSAVIAPGISVAVAVFMAFKIAQVHFILRPVLFSFFFFVVLVGWSFKAYRSGIPKISFLLFPILFCFWANVHPSFVMGLVLIVILGAGIIFDAILFPERTQTTSLKTLTLLFILAFASTLINPNGFELHKSIFELSQSEYFMKLHMEWLSPDFREDSSKFFFITIVIVVLGFYLTKKPKTWGSFELIGGTTFIWFALESQRMMPYAEIFLTIPLAEALNSIASHQWFNKFPDRRDNFLSFEKREQLAPNSRYVLSLLVILSVWGISNGIPFMNAEYGPTRKSYPYDALEWLKSRNEAQTVVISDADWGGFMTFFGEGRIKPIIDDRNTLLGENFYKSYFQGLRPGNDWRKFAQSLGGDLLMLRGSSNLANYIIVQGGKPLYQDSQVIVFSVH